MVTGSPYDQRQIVAVSMDIRDIGRSAASLAARAEAITVVLRRLIAVDGVVIAQLDPAARRFRLLSAPGYDQRVRTYFEGSEWYQDAERIHRLLPVGPVLTRDLPFPRWELPGWSDYLGPAGFQEAMGVNLYADPGRQLGRLMLASADRFDERYRQLLGALTPAIASAVDPMRSVSALARLVGDALAGVTIDAAGVPEPIPGLSGHPLLANGSALPTAVRQQLSDGERHVVFHWPAGGPDLAGSVLKVTAFTCPDLPQVESVAFLSPADELYGLSRSELELLGLLVAGHADDDLPALVALTGRSPESLADTLALALAKLDTDSVAVGTLRAVREGLYIPWHPDLVPGPGQ